MHMHVSSVHNHTHDRFNTIAKCGHPTINNLVKVMGYESDDGDDGLPADIGTTINFTCPPDLLLIGANSTTCTGNGEWAPDPSRVVCTKGNE